MQIIIFNAISWKWGGKFQRSRCVDVFIKLKISVKSRKLLGVGIPPPPFYCILSNKECQWSLKKTATLIRWLRIVDNDPGVRSAAEKEKVTGNPEKSGTQGERPFIDWRGTRGTLSRVSTTPPHPPPHRVLPPCQLMQRDQLLSGQIQ